MTFVVINLRQIGNRIWSSDMDLKCESSFKTSMSHEIEIRVLMELDAILVESGPFCIFLFCVKLKIATQNTFKPPNAAQTCFIYHTILYNTSIHCNVHNSIPDSHLLAWILI